MRILKYLFLLILLSLVGLSVYIATQRADYDVVRSQYIKAPRTAVYQYLTDLSNWEDWPQWEDGIRIRLGEKSSGIGGSLHWTDSETDGTLEIVSVKENESIGQRFVSGGFPGESTWTLKDSAGGTVVTWHVKGKLTFVPKVNATLKGGPNPVMGKTFAASLGRLEKTLVHEANTFDIKIDGQFIKPGGIYVKQSLVSTLDNLQKNIRIMNTKLDFFFSKNNISPAGKPFVLYDYYDDKRKLAKFSVCYPVKDTILTSPGSDIQFGGYGEYRAVRTTLTGDHAHLKKAWDKTFAYIQEKGFKLSDAGQYIEIMKTWRKETKQPSKWVTEIYIPIHYQAATPTPVNPGYVAPKPAPQQAPADSPTGEIPIP